VLTGALGIERITVYRAYLHRRGLVALTRYARSRRNGSRAWDDPRTRQALAELRTEYELTGLLLWRAIRMHEQGVDYRAQAAMVKLFNTEFAQRLYNEGVGMLQLYGQLREDDRRAPLNGSIAHEYLSTVQDTIGAGTSEVQREIVAIRGLGLPRG
jgi:alkylation response protein AidB-like acyl-CoA dehydrogenase